jgi:hypothetical protein
VIQKYIDFIQQLLVLLKHFHLGKEQSNQFLERKYDFYSSPEIGSVRDIRLHDLILKLAHERLAEHLKHAAIENGITYRRIDTAFSNSTGMTTMDMALDETSGINIGIQLQGNQFRYYISSNNKPLNEKFAVELFHRRLWYIDIETGQPLLGKGTRKSVYRALGLKDESGERTFCEYNKGEFIYLYKNLMDLPSGKPTVSDVIQLFIQSFKHYLKHREEFVSLVSQV